MRRLVFVAATAGAAVVLASGPAGAHAVLEGTTPTASEVLDASPSTVTFSFTESVEAALGAVRVYDGSGGRIDTSAPQHPDGDRSEVRVDLPELDDGSYVVTWRVISGDSHPIQGAFTFQVGPDATANVASLAERLLSEQGGDSIVGVAYGVDRFLVFASIALLLGGVGFVAIVSPVARGSATMRRLLWSAWCVCVASTVAGVGLQGAYAAGLGLADAAKPSVIRDVLDTRFGQTSLLRLALLAAMVPLLVRLLARGPRAEHPVPTWWLPLAVVTGIGVAATPGIAGHASAGDLVPLALVSDTIHVLAMALWVGGLVCLVAVVLPRPDVDEARGAVTRFSQLALGCVVAIVATGAFQAWRQVRTIDALRETEYGTLLIVKVVLVAVIVVVAAVSREVVYRVYQREARVVAAVGGPSLGGEPDGHEIGGPRENDADDEPPVDGPRELRRLRGSVAIEVLFAVAVLTVTALLVNTNPAKDELEGPFLARVETDELVFDVQVLPAVAGPNDLHVFALTTTGGQTDTLEMTATMEFPEQEIAPIEVPLQRLGPGHYSAVGFNVPIAGDWVLELGALVTPVDEVTAETTLTIR